MSGHLDGPPPGPPDPPYIPGDLGAPSAEEFARRRASPTPEERNPYAPSADWKPGQDTFTSQAAGIWAEGFAAGRAAATPDPPDPRLDAVYAERNAVVLGLAKAGLMLGWRVGKASDPNEPDWPVVYIDTPAGQVSWHFRAADVPDWVEPYPGEWDRHSDREKYERLSRLPTAPAASPDERLREATDALATIYVILTGAEPMWAEMPVGERCARAANEAQQAFLSLDLALAAADREENTDG